MTIAASTPDQLVLLRNALLVAECAVQRRIDTPNDSVDCTAALVALQPIITARLA